MRKNMKSLSKNIIFRSLRISLPRPPAKAGGNSAGGNSAGGNSVRGNSVRGCSVRGCSVEYLKNGYIWCGELGCGFGFREKLRPIYSQC
jgi:hypothetical protein